MRPVLPDLCLTGARVLRPEGLDPAPLAIRAGRFADGADEAGVAVDLPGYLLLPGIVDLHGPPVPPASEGPAARGGAATGIVALDRAAAAAGVTTCHLVQGWSWEGGTFAAEAAEAGMRVVTARRAMGLVDLRVKPCVETRPSGDWGRLMEAVAQFDLGYAVLQDSLEQIMAEHRLTPAVFDRRARGLGLAPEALLARVRAVQSVSLPASLRALANGFDAAGLRFGSLGDPDAETREFHAMIGARIAEFPRSRRAALAARSVGDGVLLCAAESLGPEDGPGASLARDLLQGGAQLAFASAGGFSALAAMAFHAADRGWCSLPAAWATVSAAPSWMIGLNDRGRIAPGCRADLVILHEHSRRVDAVLCDGRLVHLRSALRGRFQDLWDSPIAAQ
jgi:alpha-D-ribose 1-methylphosphonate 5-triphosphate diphosphatase